MEQTQRQTGLSEAQQNDIKAIVREATRIILKGGNRIEDGDIAAIQQVAACELQGKPTNDIAITAIARQAFNEAKTV